MGKLEGRKAVVTGGGRGIGRAIALAFAREGADVAIWDLNAANAASVAEEVKALGRISVAVSGDISVETEVVRSAEETLAVLGQVDILVNNAGIQTISPLATMPTALWDEMINVNLRSVFLCTRAFLPAMIERGFGRIISTASQLVHKGAPERTHYCAAKAGIVGMTRALAYEVARTGVTVNAICPGAIDTDMVRDMPEDLKLMKLNELPIGRFGRVDEIAPVAVLLASDEGSYFLGATMNPNGGDVMI
ncbi:SDR family NAD(P)-dependent oxidoreductase [Agrobacterium rosae]|uniref:SDR family NAD(P)-dependent oxidoreductase n=1 Tax=Agrobacterium rosae TaxID=1972867 RepID=A0AAW9FG84_9HYPH|nr:SDR family NAD(P)-dependent oxidoreductase [Agrobacterium rosae]MDX8304384.1 SDR family NAD(P)-dependent oxidoreductase [Agrobacterium rosae]